MYVQGADSQSDRSTIESESYITPMTKAERTWKATRDAEFRTVEGFPDYEFRRYISGIDVRKKGTNHLLVQHWWKEINFLVGRYVIMWHGGVKCKIDVKADIFSKKGRKHK